MYNIKQPSIIYIKTYSLIIIVRVHNIANIHNQLKLTNNLLFVICNIYYYIITLAE